MKRALGLYVLVPLPRGPQHLWNVMREHVDGFTVGDIAGCTNGVAYKTVNAYVGYWRRVGAIKVVGRRTGAPGQLTAFVYKVAIRGRTPPVERRASYTGKRGRSQLQLWTAMRTLATWTLREIVVAASTDDHIVTIHDIETYIGRLVAVGIIQIVEKSGYAKKGRSGSRDWVYRLARSHNTGPQPPRIFKASIVFDPNREKVVGTLDVREVAA